MKDSYYFPHDYNAKDDPKCERLLYEMGQEGYGIFWTLLEVLRAQPDYTYPIANLPIISRKYNADESKMRKVIYDYDLFVVIDDKIFYSDSLNRRMREVEDRRKRKSDGGKKGNAIRWGTKELSGTDRLPIAYRSDTESLTDRMKEKKSKEKKEKDSKEKSAVSPRRTHALVADNPPTAEEVIAYFVANGQNAETGRRAYEYYAAGGWRDSNGKPVRSWQQKVRAVWFGTDNKAAASTPSPVPPAYKVISSRTPLE